ncbi:MAG: molybdopterin molybdotransferase MoeA [Paracoccus sp. (in: a-proteobacteria)]|uniref:molybdopterin molybdotransferase MoeA n=1 Tax=Paracoccus sp. TaxID=267 RepID=UPI0026DEF15A|nr:gephyrin-like molybdotransferase Glp [Paracoccus sp. (in: a-proteobacteria)]MDO5630986.1 molybdopterin molybdotransferase MoeA [Paracoccus sp. (in: a-proteobacteria)]
MISVDEALTRVLALAHPPKAGTLPLAEAAGRVLLHPAVARLTQPPFDSAAMDGYALRDADLPGPLRVIGEAAAGHPWNGQATPGTAVRIFTGAPVPAGYDRVVMQENCMREGEKVTITDASGGTNIRARGGDFAEGQAIKAPRLLRAADIGLLAAMNVAQVTVAHRPRVAIIASGDELVRPGEAVAQGQIVSSNDLIVAALARDAGAVADILPIARDTESSLRDVFAQAAGADLIVTIGGASVGDHDLVGKVAVDLGLERSFYKIAMRPGKPLMAGRMGNAAMLGLPGNPVSSYVCAILFMQPLIHAMQGLPEQPRKLRARLTCDLPPEGARQHYLRARLVAGDGLSGITPYKDQDSARLTVLADADALLVRPANDPARQAGDVVDYLPLHAG